MTRSVKRTSDYFQSFSSSAGAIAGRFEPPLSKIIEKKPQSCGTCSYYKVVIEVDDIGEVGGMPIPMPMHLSWLWAAAESQVN